MKVCLASLPGNADSPNEDAITATDGAVVVLDGLTSPSRLSTGCIHGTPWYVKALGAQLIQYIGTEPDLPLAEVLRAAITGVGDLHRSSCDLTDPGSPSATVAILATRKGRVDYLVLADATIILETSSGLRVVTDSRVENVAQEQVRAAHSLPAGSKEHAESIAELVAVQRGLRNTPDGYWIAAANPDAADFAIVDSLSLTDAFRAALMTDGAARIVDLFGLSDWPNVMSALTDSGPTALLKRVREAEATDPDGTKWPRYKRGDDASVAYVEF